VDPRYVSIIYEESDVSIAMAPQYANITFERVAVLNAMAVKFAFIKIINTVV
jgi:hypothetical protein